MKHRLLHLHAQLIHVTQEGPELLNVVIYVVFCITLSAQLTIIEGSTTRMVNNMTHKLKPQMVM